MQEGVLIRENVSNHSVPELAMLEDVVLTNMEDVYDTNHVEDFIVNVSECIIIVQDMHGNGCADLILVIVLVILITKHLTTEDLTIMEEDIINLQKLETPLWFKLN
jgi:hypothetical protein